MLFENRLVYFASRAGAIGQLQATINQMTRRAYWVFEQFVTHGLSWVAVVLKHCGADDRSKVKIGSQADRSQFTNVSDHHKLGGIGQCVDLDTF
jgi:hypothetical protein